MTVTMPPARTSTKRFLPHALVATFFVMVLPALAVSVIDTSTRPWLVVVTVGLAMALSIGAASAGAAVWKRRPRSKDIVFGDLMLWGWLRRMRAERRLDQAQEILGWHAAGSGESELSRERRCEVLRELGSMLEARDAYTHGHTRRVTRHSERIAREMDLAPGEVAKVRTAAAVHDVGKLHTPREVLTKPGRLTDDEYTIVKQHPVDGAVMVAEIGDPEISAMVRHHHERMDGTGYPDGLAAGDIPLGARIIAVADTFDAMTSGRPYRAACRHKKALDVLSEEAGTQLDPAAVAAFLRYYSGKRSVAWSALFIDAPPRLISWVGGLFQGAGAGAAPLGQAIAAVGAAAVIGSTVGGPPSAAAVAESAAAVHRATASRADPAADVSGRPERRKSAAGGQRVRVRRAPLKRTQAKRPASRKRKQPRLRVPATRPKTQSIPGSTNTPSPASPKSGGNGNGPQKDKPPKANPPGKDKPAKEPKPIIQPTVPDRPTAKPLKLEKPKAEK
jgi:putative nucleotidyltransferase with HDIG domain